MNEYNKMNTLRAYYIAFTFLAFTLPLMPLQWLFNALNLSYKRTFPHWYHKNVCRILGIRLHVIGEVTRKTPAF